MYIEKVFSEVDTDERLFSVLMDEGEYALYSEFLEERTYNSKSLKKLRRLTDYLVGEVRLDNAKNAENAFLWGKANYPGEIVKRAYRDGSDYHILTDYRPGVTPEKAKRLSENVQKMKEFDPKRYLFHQGLVAGRDTIHGPSGYSTDLSKLNHRINAKGLGEYEEALLVAKDELKRRKSLGWKPKSSLKTLKKVIKH